MSHDQAKYLMAHKTVKIPRCPRALQDCNHGVGNQGDPLDHTAKDRVMLAKERRGLCSQLPTGPYQVYLKLCLGSGEQLLQMQEAHFVWCSGNPLRRGWGLLSPAASKGQKRLAQLHPGWGGQSPPRRCLWTGGWEHKVSLDWESQAQAGVPTPVLGDRPLAPDRYYHCSLLGKPPAGAGGGVGVRRNGRHIEEL